MKQLNGGRNCRGVGVCRQLQDKCRISAAGPPQQPPLRPECKRFHRPHCRAEPVQCPTLYGYDESQPPPTETCEEYLTKPMRLPQIRYFDIVDNNPNTVFAI